MADNLMGRLAGMAPPPGMVPLHIPSDAEKANLKRVEKMNVRTQAGAFASQCLAGERPTYQEWVAFARVIELYLWGEVDPLAAAPPVQPKS